MEGIAREVLSQVKRGPDKPFETAVLESYCKYVVFRKTALLQGLLILQI